jgi:hypothetical protein
MFLYCGVSHALNLVEFSAVLGEDFGFVLDLDEVTVVEILEIATETVFVAFFAEFYLAVFEFWGAVL